MAWIISLTILISVIWTKPEDMAMWFMASGLFAISGSIGFVASNMKENKNQDQDHK